MSTAAQTKQPSRLREPTIPELVIPDLKAMERSGNYNREVLLWLQDGYVNRAIKEHLPQLKDLHTRLVESGESPDEARRQKTQALVEFTCASYATEKAAGRGADLKSYIDAAKTFFESEVVRYGGHLQELAEYIKKALENGEKPDIDRHSRHGYVSYHKLNQVMKHLGELQGKPAALQVMNMMKKGVERLHFVTVGDQPTNVGRRLWEAIEMIAENPSRYISMSDPSRMEMPERGPWDYEPMHRQGGYNPGF